MTKMVREYLDVPDNASLDDVIAVLTELRATLPAGAKAEVRMRGDDVFGRRLSICYERAQTDAEAELEARYAPAADALLAEVASYERIEGEFGIAA